MNPANFPIVGMVFRYGASDRVLDSILLLGPVIILGFVFLGRNPITVTVTGFYILSFLGYVLYNGLRANE